MSISFSTDFLTASMPRQEKISQMSLLQVRMGSTSLSARTFISAVPSVSKIHSEILLNSPRSVSTILFLSSVLGRCMYTLEIASRPCNVMSLSMFASMHLRNMSSSILSAWSSSSSFPSSLFIILIRNTSFSALSSLKMQLRSSPKPALIFSLMCSMVSLLSVILFLSNSILSSQFEILFGSKSGIS